MSVRYRRTTTEVADAPLAGRSHSISLPTAYTLLTLTMFLWSANIVIARSVHELVPGIGFAFWRGLCAALMLAPFVALETMRRWPIIRAHWRIYFMLGALLAVNSVCMMLAVQFTTAINVALVNALQPVITVLAAAALGRERIGRWQGLGIVAGGIGVTVMVTRAEFEVLRTLSFNAGDILVLFATLGYAAYALAIHRLPQGIGVFPSLFPLLVASTVTILPFYIVETIVVEPVTFSWQIAAAVLAVALLWGVAAVYCWNKGNRVVGPSRAGVFINLFPVFSAALAIVFLGEQIYLFHLVGAVLVCAGITLVVTTGRGKKPA
jgi:drug/metabolite transporter (DMT)-like permease